MIHQTPAKQRPVIKWIREAYRGYLWPLVTVLAAFFAGSAGDSHTRWHDATWPVYAVAIIAAWISRSKINGR